MCGVDVQSTSVQGECDRVVVQRRVGRGIVLDIKAMVIKENCKWDYHPRTVAIGVLVNLATNS